jgi:hypothetical protein
LAPSDNIEDRFTSAVKSALDASRGKDQPTETAADAAQAQGAKKRRHAVALLCLALAAIALVVAAAVLHVQHYSLARLGAEGAAMLSGSISDRFDATAVTSGPDTSVDSTAATPGLTPAAASVTPSAATSATIVATPDASAMRSSSAFTAATDRAPTPGAPAAGEDRYPVAAPSAPPGRSKISRQAHGPADQPTPSVSVAGAGDEIAADASAPVVFPEARTPAPSAKVRIASGKPASVASQIGGAQAVASGGSEPSAAGATASPAGATATTNKAQKLSLPGAATARVVLVSSPDHSVYWALETLGKIFRSIDGKAWQKQDSGVRSDLLAGQAPSSTVCWAVGRKGTILLTTDGVQWQRIQSPTTADIVAVKALSADVADIVVADGSRLSTFDRGSNWTPAS